MRTVEDLVLRARIRTQPMPCKAVAALISAHEEPTTHVREVTNTSWACSAGRAGAICNCAELQGLSRQIPSVSICGAASRMHDRSGIMQSDLPCQFNFCGM